MNEPEHLRPAASRCGLNGYFVDFHLLPELLCRTRCMNGKDAIQWDWALFLKQTDYDDHYQALEVEYPSVTRTAGGAWRLANMSGLLTPVGLTDLGQRVVDGTADVEDALALGVRECMIGQDGIEIVPLLQRGASILAKTNHVWARCCPGLLPIEMEAIVYWACAESPRCLKLLDELIILREAAMHRVGGPPDRRMSDAENAELHEEMVTNFYLSHRDLAEDSPMPYGGTLAMTRLLGFTGLLHARNIRGRSVYLIPPA